MIKSVNSYPQQIVCSRAAEAKEAAAEASRLVRDPEEWDTAEQGKSTWQVEC